MPSTIPKASVKSYMHPKHETRSEVLALKSHKSFKSPNGRRRVNSQSRPRTCLRTGSLPWSWSTWRRCSPLVGCETIDNRQGKGYDPRAHKLCRQADVPD